MKKYLIILHGPSGAGKSTIAEFIKTKIKPSVHLGTDRIRFLITDSQLNEEAMRTSSDILPVLVSEYLKRGFNVVIDHQVSKTEVNLYKEISKEHDATLLSYEINTEREILNQRIEKRQKELNKPQPSKKWIDQQYENYSENKFKDSIKFNSSNLTSEEIANAILKDLK